jgi:hypothetical protein
MKTSDLKATVRRLCAVWASTKRFDIRAPTERPSFTEFSEWLRENGYGHLLNSHSLSGAANDIERWFNDEFRQA